MPNNNQQPGVFLQSGDPTTENRLNTLYPGQLGSNFTQQDPNDSNRSKRWQIVQMDSAVDVAASAGAVAWWRDRTGYVVTTDVSVAGRGEVAGVFACLVDVTNIGCVQQGGPASVQIQTSPTSPPDDTGKQVIPSATDAKADVLAAGSAASYTPLGVSSGFLSSGAAPVNLDVPSRP